MQPLAHLLEAAARLFQQLLDEQFPILKLCFSRFAGGQELMNQVIEFYYQTLLESPEALAYLARRGLTDADIMQNLHSCMHTKHWNCCARVFYDAWANLVRPPDWPNQH